MKSLLSQIAACEMCQGHLPHGPRPVVVASRNSRIIIIGQAPGLKVHATGIPWNDASGEELRRWLQVDKDRFYDPELFALTPMGFCYPGKGKSGDLPPRPECAPQWHAALIRKMKRVELTLLIGQYSQNYYLGERRKANLTENVRHFREFLPAYFPLVHPSPRNRLWQKRNPWFESEVLPELRRAVSRIL